jgi:predicted oxidoreductase
MRACDGAEAARPADLARFLGAAHDAGAAWIDSADIYAGGGSETLVGEALALDPGLRDRFKIIAKAGVVLPGRGVATQHYRNDASHLRTQLEASLKRLKLSRVDLFLVHRPDYLMDAAETAAALKAMVADGLTRAVGVSNFSIWQTDRLARALGEPVAADQLEFSVLATQALDDGRLDYALAHGASVFAWGPLAAGRLFSAEAQDAVRVRSVLGPLAGSEDPDAIAGAALAWLARHPARPIPVLGSCRIKRLARQAAAMGAIEMTGEDWYAVLEAARGARVP